MNENHKCPICGGELVSEDELFYEEEELINEEDDTGHIMLKDLLDEKRKKKKKKKKKKRDACYYKVRSRYKVWPSAYASGALVKCRKKGAKNWGTKSEGIGEVEQKIKLNTDPNWYGAEVGDYKATGPVIEIPTNKLVGFEPEKKMEEPKSKANVEKIVSGLKSGDKLPPILVRKYKDGYQVIDGHHRFWAYKLLNKNTIPAKIVPDEDIEVVDKHDATLDEKWSEKYKRSINCNNPRGFSQRAHCQGRKKTEEEIMKEEQLKNIIREMVMDELKCWDGYKRVPGKSSGEKGSCTKMEEQSPAHDESMEECWECYQTGVTEGTGEIIEECYRTTRWYMVPDADEHTCEGDQFYEVYGDIDDSAPLMEAKYRGRTVKLGKPMRGDVKKFKVFVRKPNGKIVKVNFGDKKMRIKKSNPKRRKSFRARHKCKTPGPRWKARYWSCRKW